MKNNVYITGIICLAITLVAVLFKLSHVAGAGVLLIIGLGSISFIFLPITYLKLRKSTDDVLLRFVYFAAFASFVIDFIGALFKLMHWPGAEWFLVVGIPLPFVFFLPVYIVYHAKRKLKTDFNFFAVIMFMIYLGVFSSLLSMNPNYNINKSYAYATNSISGSNNYLSDELSHSQSSTLSNKNKELINQLEKLRIVLIAENSSQKQRTIPLEGEIDYVQIEKLGSLTSLHNSKNQEFVRFNDLFEKYCSLPESNVVKSNTQRLIDEINVYRLPRQKGEIPIIGQMSLISVLNTLTDWQNKILLIEFTNSFSGID